MHLRYLCFLFTFTKQPYRVLKWINENMGAANVFTSRMIFVTLILLSGKYTFILVIPFLIELKIASP